MIFNIILFIAILAYVSAVAKIPVSPKVSASIRDTNVNGVEGFNINLVAPFKFQDNIFGFRYSLGNLRKTPESLFYRRTFNTPLDSKLSVNSDYIISDNLLNVQGKWSSNALNLTVGADGDSKNYLKNVLVSKSFHLNNKFNNQINVASSYNLIKKKIISSLSLTNKKNNLVVDLTYDNEFKDPLLMVSRSLDESNVITPSIRLKSGEMVYGYKRLWDTGSLLASYYPGKKVTLEWTDYTDKNLNNKWLTTAELPINDPSKTKVTLSREWNY